MATKDQRYDPDINYDSDQEELNNTRDQWSVSPPSSPVDQVYLAGDYIYNDVRPAAGVRSGGPLADPPDKKKQQPAGEKKDCIYCKKPIDGRSWSGSGFICHTGDPAKDAEHDQFCERCARGKLNDDELREADEERGVMTCPKHKKLWKAANAADLEPYQV